MDQSDLNALNTRLLTHETQCEERWKTNFARLEILEKKLDKLYAMTLAATGAAVVFLGGVILVLTTQ